MKTKLLNILLFWDEFESIEEYSVEYMGGLNFTDNMNIINPNKQDSN